MKELRVLMVNDIANRVISDFEDRIYYKEYVEEGNEEYKEDNDNREISEDYTLNDIDNSDGKHEEDKEFFLSYLDYVKDFESEEYFAVFKDYYEEKYLNEGFNDEEIEEEYNKEGSVEDTILLNDLLHDRFFGYC